MGQIERNKRLTWLQAFWVLSDAVAIVTGFALGYWTRFLSPLTAWIPASKGIPPLSLYLAGAAVTLLVWVPLFNAMGLYRLERGRTSHRPKDLVRGLLFGMVGVAALSFFYRGASFSRLAVPFIWLYSAVLILGLRAWVTGLVRRSSRVRPIRFAVVGESPIAATLVQSLRRSSYPHQFVGWFGVAAGATPPPASDRSGPGDAGPRLAPYLGPAGAIRDRAGELQLDLVILAPIEPEPELLRAVVEQCQELDLDFQFVPDLLPLWGRSVRVDEIEGLPVLRLRELPLSGWSGVVKRTVDLVVSTGLLLVLWPLFLIIAIAVKLDSSGPVFIRQDRMGRDRRPFPMLKFRSMRVDAETSSGPVWAQSNDPRRTRSGVFLRKWSLDELPQLWNVFVGQMSLVGPRPEREFFVQQFEGHVLDYRDRHRIKSGVTGWAQVHGLRGNVPIEERTRYDLYYIENWSLWLDLRILWMTLRAVVTHRGE
ncbi:MAG: sugar transferase [Candidatus Eisenbacteria bacterium]|nr:sugar transferase [Candidatus Eisenbacteria bacterium]